MGFMAVWGVQAAPARVDALPHLPATAWGFGQGLASAAEKHHGASDYT
jgi:hypothetical protein